MKYSSMIGSLPHKNPQEAVELVFNNLTLPTYPQLPKISFQEQMHIQYTENFPGIIVDEQTEKVWVEEEKFYSEVTNFFQNFIDNELDYFKISSNYSSGFYEFIKQLPNYKNNFSAIKLQITGPITFGLTIKTQKDRAILYDEQMKDTVIKIIAMKSIWQIKEVLSVNPKIEKIILFFDEPYLAAYGSAFTAISMDDVRNILNNTITEIKNILSNITILSPLLKFNIENQLYFGIHCCANTDWGMLTDLDFKIISFDAHNFFNDFILYSEHIKKFVDKEKTIAWGIVPNNKNIDIENVDYLLQQLEIYVNLLEKKGINKSKIVNNIIVTPQCGLGGVSQEIAEKVLKTCNELTLKI